MRARHAWLIVGLLACTKARPTQESEPTPAAKMPPAPPAPASTVTISMTAATLADDCGGVSPPAAPTAWKPAQNAGSSSSSDDAYSGGARERVCEQTSMKLSVVMPAGGAATQLTVKKVELFDDKGALIGELTPRAPTVWADAGTYKAWDQKIAPGQELSVSYALSRPPWGSVTDRWNRTYVLKAVITVGGGERSIQRDIHIAAPTMLPPNAAT